MPQGQISLRPTLPQVVGSFGLRSTGATAAAAGAACAAAVEEQGAATQDIARSVGSAAKGTTSVATNITDMNRGASETGTASGKVLSAAQSLSKESNRLKVEVERFLSTVRAA